MAEPLEKKPLKKTGRERWRGLCPRAVALCLALTGLVVFFGMSVTAIAEVRVLPHTREEVQLSYAPLVRQVAPAVVDVFARRAGAHPARAPLLNDEFLRQFFGDEGPLAGAERKHLLRSLGSGVIVDPKGLVVTTSRVAAGEPALGVALADGRQFSARLVLIDRRSGLAVLSIEGGNGPFPALSLRDSDQLEVGDLVLAVGDPFGLGAMVTSGVLSALEPTPGPGSHHISFIRTDAAIGPANQGGALVTMDGRLAGIVALVGPRAMAPAVGFVVPSNAVAHALAAALSGHGIMRPWLGAAFQPLPAQPAPKAGQGQEAASETEAETGTGLTSNLRVRAVYPGSPAARAGIKPHDVVTAIDGRGVVGLRSLEFRVSGYTVGEHILVSVNRDGRFLDLPVILQAPPAVPPPEYVHIQGTSPLAGAIVGNLSPALADRLDLDFFARGVAITAIKPGSWADRSQLGTGERIVSVDGVKVKDTGQLEQLLAPRRRHWKIVVLHDDGLSRLIEK